MLKIEDIKIGNILKYENNGILRIGLVLNKQPDSYQHSAVYRYRCFYLIENKIDLWGIFEGNIRETVILC